MGHAPSFDPVRNVVAVGERRLVFHCHHYNVFLQRSLEDMLGDAAITMQIDAAAEAARELLAPVLDDGSLAARLAQASAFFAENGFGTADVSALDRDGGAVLLATSHYAIGWRAKLGAAERPVCHFATGFWAGALAAAAGLAPERIVAVEEECAAVRGDACRVRVEVR